MKIVDQITEVSDDEVAAEWVRRASRPGLLSVMRASQPADLTEDVTLATRRHISSYLRTIGSNLDRPVETVLEVGCGIGRITPVLASQAGHVTAIDMTQDMLRAASRGCAHLGNVDFVHCRAEEFSWDTSEFDVGLSVWVLMHVLDDEALRTICAGLARSCRYLILVEYEHDSIPVGRYSALRSLDSYLELLPGARVVERNDLDYGGDQSFVALIELAR